MKPITLRFIAVLLLVIPGFAATYGFLAMKDAFFCKLRTRDFFMGEIHCWLFFVFSWSGFYRRLDIFQRP